MRLLGVTSRVGGITLILLAISSISSAQNALIVHDGTPGMEANIVAALSSKLTAHSFTVTTNVGVPGSLTGYQQVWDLRYSNTTPLSPSDITAYVAYMAGGGSLFVMGENAGFVTRDTSIVALITAAGGGTVALTTPNNTQTVNAPFTGPDAVTSVTFLAAAGTSSPGTGSLITHDDTGIGAAVVWAPGRMSAASAGTLIVVFDVNFLDPTAAAPLQALTNNLIAYLAAPTPIGPAVPAPSSVLLLLVGAAGVAVFEFLRRRRIRKA